MNKVTGRVFFGCESADDSGGNVMAQRQSGVMTMVEEIGPGDFRIAKEYPSKVTGVVVKKLDGSQDVIPEEKISSILDQAKTEKIWGWDQCLPPGLSGL